MRVGLVLGAGAYPGHAWHVGVLRGIEDALRWDAREAALVVGTSIGAITGAAIRGGFAVADLAAAVLGEPLSDRGHGLATHHIDPPHALPPDVGPLRFPSSLIPSGVGALRALAAMDEERHVRSLVLGAVGGLLPRGRASLEPVARSLDVLHGSRWPGDDLWVVATRVTDGRREVFGQHRSPVTTPGTACAASGSIPGVFAPVRIGGHLYCDAGIGSTTNADLVVERTDLDLVVVSAPLGSRGRVSWSLDAPIRAVTSAQVRHEVDRLCAAGHHVVHVAPDSAAARAMGLNPLVDDRAAQATVLGLARRIGREAVAHVRTPRRPR